jgi:hypothetical protein
VLPGDLPARRQMRQLASQLLKKLVLKKPLQNQQQPRKRLRLQKKPQSLCQYFKLPQLRK